MASITCPVFCLYLAKSPRASSCPVHRRRQEHLDIGCPHLQHFRRCIETILQLGEFAMIYLRDGCRGLTPADLADSANRQTQRGNERIHNSIHFLKQFTSRQAGSGIGATIQAPIS